MIKRLQEFTVLPPAPEVTRRLLAGVEAMPRAAARATINDTVLVKFTPDWRRNPSDVDVRIRTDDAGTKVTLDGRIKGFTPAQGNHLMAQMEALRMVIETDASPEATA